MIDDVCLRIDRKRHRCNQDDRLNCVYALVAATRLRLTGMDALSNGDPHNAGAVPYNPIHVSPEPTLALVMRAMRWARRFYVRADYFLHRAGAVDRASQKI